MEVKLKNGQVFTFKDKLVAADRIDCLKFRAISLSDGHGTAAYLYNGHVADFIKLTLEKVVGSDSKSIPLADISEELVRGLEMDDYELLTNAAMKNYMRATGETESDSKKK